MEMSPNRCGEERLYLCAIIIPRVPACMVDEAVGGGN